MTTTLVTPTPEPPMKSASVNKKISSSDADMKCFDVTEIKYGKWQSADCELQHKRQKGKKEKFFSPPTRYGIRCLRLMSQS
uniref:Uncharacterized protein n=1 Tax=Glossina palpalis gambiensis TaxID=67801 RepID=A0A1B0BSP8_9MUSC